MTTFCTTLLLPIPMTNETTDGYTCKQKSLLLMINRYGNSCYYKRSSPLKYHTFKPFRTSDGVAVFIQSLKENNFCHNPTTISIQL